MHKTRRASNVLDLHLPVLQITFNIHYIVHYRINLSRMCNINVSLLFTFNTYSKRIKYDFNDRKCKRIKDEKFYIYQKLAFKASIDVKFNIYFDDSRLIQSIR